MRSYAQQKKPTQLSKSAVFRKPEGDMYGQNSAAISFLRLQRTIGNRSVQRICSECEEDAQRSPAENWPLQPKKTSGARDGGKVKSSAPNRVSLTPVGHPMLSRWEQIGEENYTACTDPPYYWPQTCARSENRRLTPIEIKVGTEPEWRALLDSRSHQAQKSKRMFLRSVYINDSRFPGYAVQRRNWDLLIDFVYGQHDLRAERQLSRVPTHDEKMAFARALFLRRGTQLAEWRNEYPLLAGFIREYQHFVLEEEARAGRIFSRQQSELLIPGQPRGQFFNPASGPVGMAILTNGSAMLMRGLALYIHNYVRNQTERGHANRIIQSAGNIMRESAETIDRLSEAEKRNFERSLNLLVDVFSIPGASTISRLIRSSFKATVTPGIGGAFRDTREATDRMQTIQTRVIAWLEGYDYQRAGHEAAAGQTLKERLQTMVRSLLQ